MGILVVGSVALDDVSTPAGRRCGILGGACTYFATAASLYEQVSMVAVVGEDFPEEHIAFLRGRNVDLSGLQVAAGRTFHWSGRYGDDLGDALTLDTQLNVFGGFHPLIPTALRDSEYVFLANIHPELQIEVLEQMRAPKLTALDSMNYWIESSREALTKAISMVDLVLLNEAEVRMYAGTANLLDAAQAILDLGPGAVVNGTIIASFTVEDFSIDRLRTLTPAEVRQRYDEFRLVTHYDGLSEEEIVPLARSIR